MNRIIYKYIARAKPFIGLSLLMLFPLLSYGLQSIFIIVSILISLVFFRKKIRQQFNKIGINPFLLNCSFFLIMMFTIIYSDYPSRGLKIVEKSISLVIIPVLIFYLSGNLKRETISFLLKFFVGINVVLIAYFFIFFFQTGIFEEGPFSRLLRIFPYRKYLANHEYKDWHASYVSMWFNLSIFILLIETKWGKKNVYDFFKILLILLFYFSVISLLSRTTIVSLHLCLIFYFFKILKTTKQKFFLLTGLIVFTSLAVGVVSNNRTLKTRLVGNSKLFFSNSNQEKNQLKTNKNSRNIAKEISLELIKKNYVFGYGLGGVQPRINKLYSDMGFSELKTKNLNSHNNYIYFMLVGGVVLLVTFCIMLFYNIRLSLKNRDILFLLFLTIIGLSMITENILVRMHGILFFSIFNSILFYRNILIDGTHHCK